MIVFRTLSFQATHDFPAAFADMVAAGIASFRLIIIVTFAIGVLPVILATAGHSEEQPLTVSAAVISRLALK